MKATKRFLLTLAAILGMTGVWAQDADEVAVTKTANNNEWTLTMPASDVELQVEYYRPFDLTLADGSNAHGTVAFTVGDAAATQALKDDVVTVSVTPADGYTVKGVTAKTSSQVVVPMTNGENGWTFTMPEENVAVTVTYAKNLQDAWIQAIADQTYTGSAIEPSIEVKDGETTLVLNTDYTVAYSNNTNAGTATVTVTAVEGSNYSGTATKTFNIVKADITPTAPVALTTLVYNTKAQPLIEAGQAEGGEMQYSLDGQSWSTNIPTATNAGDYTVNYCVVGDANHNDVAAKTLTVTIAQAELTNVTLAETSFVYNGQEQKPAVTVKDGETVLTEDVDYTVGYSNNVEGGSQGVVTITGIGNYSGTVTKNFNVVAAVYSTANAAIDVNVPQGLGQLTPETTGQTTDLYYFLQSYLQNSPNPAYIKLRLASMGQYVISQPLTVLSAITIEGDAEGIATIDATQLGKNPFARIDNNHTSGMLNEKGYCTNMYNVELKNIEIQYLSGALFNANGQKYVIPQLTIENVNVRLLGSEAINLTGSALEKLILSKSTLSAAKATLYKAGAAPETAGSGNPAITASYNTFWGVGKLDGITDYNKQVSVDFNHNIVIDYDGFVADLNADPAYLLAQYNAFQKPKTSKVDGQLVVEFEDVSDAEDAKGAAGSIKGALVMANGVDGIAEGDFSLDACPQKEAKIGDPRWLNASLLSKLITPESLDDDNDLAKAINQGVQEGFVKFQLAENQRYTVKQTIVADKGLVIRGKNVVIDVEHADAFVLMGKTPTGGFMPKSSTETAAPALTDEAAAAQNRAAGVEYTDYYKFDELTLSGLKVNGLKNSIIYDNNVKYCVIDLTIDNCVMQLETEAVKNDALIAFQAGGVNNLTIKNSTFYGNNEVAKYFVRYNNSARIDRFGFDKADDTWSFTYENNTFYGLLKSDGQWGNYSGIVGKNAQGIVTVKNNIWYNCDAQTMRRMLGSKNFSQFSKASLMENNTFFVGGAAADQGNYGNGSDLTGDPGFKRPAEGDFTLSAYSVQYDKKTGDPRWYADGGHYNPVTGIEGVEAEKADDGAWYTLQGTRVSKPAKGLYIHNGKKVVIK